MVSDTAPFPDPSSVPASNHAELLDYFLGIKLNHQGRLGADGEILKQLERKIQVSHACFHDTSKTFLEELLEAGQLLQWCPIEVVEQILRAQPDAILRMRNDEVPLAKAIKGGKDLTKIVEAMIKVLEEEQKKNEATPLLGVQDGVGEECIRAAFRFNKRDGTVLPLRIDLIERLISLAEPKLFMIPFNKLLPLQEAVHYNVCREEPHLVLGLVRKILDRCEECIARTVDHSATLKVHSKKEMKWLPKGLSVYRWHMETRQKVKAWLAEAAGTAGTAGQSQDASTADVARMTNGSTLNIAPNATANGYPQNDWRRGMIKTGTAKVNQSVLGVDVAAGESKDRHHGDRRRTGKDEMKDAAKSNPSESGPNPPPASAPQRTNTMTNTRGTTDTERDAAAEKASKEIRDELTLRYLRWTLASPRTRKAATSPDGTDAAQEGESHDRDSEPKDIIADAKSFFGKKGNDTERYWFVLDMHKEYPLLYEDRVCALFGRHTYSSTLQLVVLSQVRIQLRPEESQPTRFTDQLFFLRWLRTQEVRKIIKLTVDNRQEAHRDEDIEEVVGGWDDQKNTNTLKSFDVEILDWRKVDLCPVTIRRAAPNVRELHLQWSGSNSVLFGWSDTQCLPKLPLLRTICIHYTTPSARHARAKKNLVTFKSRMAKSRRHWKTESMKNDSTAPGHYLDISIEEHDTVIVGSNKHPGEPGNTGEKSEDLWFKYVRQFVELVPGLPKGSKQVRVALIDDGVDIFSESLAIYGNSFYPGDSFDTSVDGPGPEHTSVSGHGTVMAECILRMCPRAIIVPIRLMMNAGYRGFTPRPEPLSAAKAVQLAIEAGVDIISMSWTIPFTESDQDREDLRGLASVVSDAKRKKLKIPLMFCSAADDGLVSGERGKSYPRHMDTEIFVIGAARSDTGETWSMVSQPSYVHFGVPGVEIESVVTGSIEGAKRTALTSEHQKGRTGSSIATALAAGLAALLIHCMHLGMYYTKEMDDKGERADDVLRPNSASSRNNDIRTFSTMRTALQKLSLVNGSGDNFMNPKERFQSAREDLEKYHDASGVERAMPGSLAPIATMIRSMVG